MNNLNNVKYLKSVRLTSIKNRVSFMNFFRAYSIKTIIIIFKYIYLILKGIFIPSRALVVWKPDHFYLVLLKKLLSLYYFKKLFRFYYVNQYYFNVAYHFIIFNLLLHICLYHYRGADVIVLCFDYLKDNITEFFFSFKDKGEQEQVYTEVLNLDNKSDSNINDNKEKLLENEENKDTNNIKFFFKIVGVGLVLIVVYLIWQQK